MERVLTLCITSGAQRSVPGSTQPGIFGRASLPARAQVLKSQEVAIGMRRPPQLDENANQVFCVKMIDGSAKSSPMAGGGRHVDLTIKDRKTVNEQKAKSILKEQAACCWWIGNVNGQDSSVKMRRKVRSTT